VLINELGEGGGPNGFAYVRGTDGSPAIPIGEGFGMALSPDGRLVLVAAPPAPRSLVLLPVGPGTPRPVTDEGISGNAGGLFLPDGKRLLVQEGQAGQVPRILVASIDGGKPRQLAPHGFVIPVMGNPFSPDGRTVVLVDGEKKVHLGPIE